MLVMKIMTFRELAVIILGELSPSMSFLYDIFAAIFAFLFILIIYGFFTFFRKFRW